MTRRGGRGHGPARRHAGGRRRRRPVGERGRRRGRHAGTVALSLGTSGVVFATTDRADDRPARPGPRVLPRGPREVAPDDGDAVRRRAACAGSATRSRRASTSASWSRRPASVPAGQRRPAVPALPHRRAQPASRPAGPRRVRRPDRDPRPAPPDPVRPRGRGLRPARRPRPDDRGRDAGARPGPRLRRRDGERPSGARSSRTSCDAEIATVSTTEGAAYGAALLAAVGAGWFPTVEAAADALVTATVVARRRARTSAAYAECHARYRELYPRSPRRSTGPVARGAQSRRSSASSFSETSSGSLPMMIIARTSSLVTLSLSTVPDELALEHDADPVRQVEHVVDVVADQEDADALGLQLADELADLRGLGRPERRGRLVHDQDPGVEVDRAGDRHRLALAAGQRLDRDLEVPEASG